jgi:hypothetical protein
MDCTAEKIWMSPTRSGEGHILEMSWKGKTMSCQPPMTLGMVNIPPKKNGDAWGIVYCFTHINQLHGLFHYLQAFNHPRWCRISPSAGIAQPRWPLAVPNSQHLPQTSREVEARQPWPNPWGGIQNTSYNATLILINSNDNLNYDLQFLDYNIYIYSYWHPKTIIVQASMIISSVEHWKQNPT